MSPLAICAHIFFTLYHRKKENAIVTKISFAIPVILTYNYSNV